MEENKKKTLNEEKITKDKSDHSEISGSENLRKKRRSKSVVDGRTFVCQCGKAYLSQPALNNHMKIKHSGMKINELDPNNLMNKKRGRPKKGTSIPLNEKIYKNFFHTKERMITEDNLPITNSEYINMINEVFNYLFCSDKFSFQNTFENEIDKHHLFNIILNKISQNEKKYNQNVQEDKEIIKNEDNIVNVSTLDTKNEASINSTTSSKKDRCENNNQLKNENNSIEINQNLTNSELSKFSNHSTTKVKKKFKKIKKNTDLVFAEYLEHCKNHCNKNYLKNILIFIVIYRELINKIKKGDFTEKKRPGKILELSNEFFDYLIEIQVIDEFNDDVKINFVENFIHLSYWLYVNSLTHTRICLGFLSCPSENQTFNNINNDEDNQTKQEENKPS